MKFKIGGFVLLLLSFIALKAVRGDDMGTPTTPVSNPDISRVIPLMQNYDETVKDLDDRITSTMNSLRVQRKEENLSPEEYHEYVGFVNQIIEDEQHLWANQGGSLTPDQLDSLNTRLDQVEDQLDQFSIN